MTAGDIARGVGYGSDWLARRIDARLAGGRLGLAERTLPDELTRHRIGSAVLGAPTGAAFVHRALAAALDADPRSPCYMSDVLDAAAACSPRAVQILPPSRFYAIPPSQSFRLFEQSDLELPLDAMTVHLVASNHRRLLTRIGEHDPQFDRSDAVFWRTGREIRALVGTGHAPSDCCVESARTGPLELVTEPANRHDASRL